MPTEYNQKVNDLLSAFDIILPLTISTEDAATAVDATGRDVFTVDVNGARPDEEACIIAELILGMINRLGGSKPKQSSVQ